MKGKTDSECKMSIGHDKWKKSHCNQMFFAIKIAITNARKYKLRYENLP